MKGEGKGGDVVGVRIGEGATGTGFNQDLHGLKGIND